VCFEGLGALVEPTEDLVPWSTLQGALDADPGTDHVEIVDPANPDHDHERGIATLPVGLQERSVEIPGWILTDTRRYLREALAITVGCGPTRHYSDSWY